jgi:hypothetical protein
MVKREVREAGTREEGAEDELSPKRNRACRLPRERRLPIGVSIGRTAREHQPTAALGTTHQTEGDAPAASVSRIRNDSGG